MSLQNPMGLNGPGANANPQQADYRVPTPTESSLVASYAVGFDGITITRPIPAFVQPGTSAPTGVNPAWPLGQASNAGSPFRLQ